MFKVKQLATWQNIVHFYRKENPSQIILHFLEKFSDIIYNWKDVLSFSLAEHF